jgi:hypothetical protein
LAGDELWSAPPAGREGVVLPLGAAERRDDVKNETLL